MINFNKLPKSAKNGIVGLLIGGTTLLSSPLSVSADQTCKKPIQFEEKVCSDTLEKKLDDKPYTLPVSLEINYGFPRSETEKIHEELPNNVFFRGSRDVRVYDVLSASLTFPFWNKKFENNSSEYSLSFYGGAGLTSWAGNERQYAELVKKTEDGEELINRNDSTESIKGINPHIVAGVGFGNKEKWNLNLGLKYHIGQPIKGISPYVGVSFPLNNFNNNKEGYESDLQND